MTLIFIATWRPIGGVVPPAPGAFRGILTGGVVLDAPTRGGVLFTADTYGGIVLTGTLTGGPNDDR